MTKYSLIHGNSTIEFRTLQEAEAYKLAHNLPCDVIQFDEVLPNNAKNEALERLQRDEAFGNSLIEEFLLDNRLIDPPVTSSQSAMLLQKFDAVSKLCDKGDIKTVADILPLIPLDEIYTEARQQKYIAMIASHLGNL